jgi:hypothetical protein
MPGAESAPPPAQVFLSRLQGKRPLRAVAHRQLDVLDLIRGDGTITDEQNGMPVVV